VLDQLVVAVPRSTFAQSGNSQIDHHVGQLRLLASRCGASI
jgi:hypothetical protein